MSDIKIPEIRINYAWLLQMDVSRKINERNKWPLPTDEEAEEYTENYRRAWKLKGSMILSRMQECLGISFYKSVIDVNIAADIIPKSQPLIIDFSTRPNHFVDLLTHELAHVLLTDNTAISLMGADRNFELGLIWQKLFDNEKDFATVFEIPAYAVFKKIAIDIHNDESRIARDKKDLVLYKATPNIKAWEYVEKVGHEVIIEKLKKSYAEIEMRKSADEK